MVDKEDAICQILIDGLFSDERDEMDHRLTLINEMEEN